jgi:DeoR family deoxyribose operon repressor
MIKATRLEELDKALAEFGTLHLRDAARRLGVSEMTVRRDVAADPGRYACLGGHIVRVAQDGTPIGYVIQSEKDHFAQAKRQACRNALARIRAHDSVFVDCGTTLVALADLIPADMPLTVVCYSLEVARLFAQKSRVRLFLLGGWYHASSDSFGGEHVLRDLAEIGVNKAFISAAGVDARYGVTCWNPHEKPVKQEAMKLASQRFLVVDSSKMGQRRPVRFAQLGAFDEVITEKS